MLILINFKIAILTRLHNQFTMIMASVLYDLI